MSSKISLTRKGSAPDSLTWKEEKRTAHDLKYCVLQNHCKTHHFQQILLLIPWYKNTHNGNRKLEVHPQETQHGKKAQLATQTTPAISSIDFNCMFLFLQFDGVAFVCYRNQLLQSLHRCCKLLIWWCLAVYLVFLSVCYLLFILSSLLAMYSSIYSFIKESKAIVCRSFFKPYSPSAPEHPFNIGMYTRFQYI